MANKPDRLPPLPQTDGELFRRKEARSELVSQKPLASPVVVSHNVAAVSPAVSQTLTYRYRDAEKRRAYMRKHMAEKRAREKAE